MSRRQRCVQAEEGRQRSCSTDSYRGLQYQADLTHHSKKSRDRSVHSQYASSKSLSPLEEQVDEEAPHWNHQRPKPNLDQLGKENIKRPSNVPRKSPQEFFQQQAELKHLKQARKKLQAEHKQQLLLREEQLNGLLHLKEENQLNLEQLSRLRHLATQFQVQLRRIAKEKETCQGHLKDAKREIAELKDHAPTQRLEEQYELICAENREKLHALEGQLKTMTQSLEEAGRDNQLLRTQLAEKQLQPSQEQRLNEYVARASEAQNRANELQIRYFRMQKENDENKQARTEAELELRQTKQALQSQKQLFQEEEDKLLNRIKVLESERRRSDIERTNLFHEKDVLHNRMRKEKDAEIDRLRLELDKLTFDLQEVSKGLQFHNIERESDAKAYKISLESLELEYRKARAQLERTAVKNTQESQLLRSQLESIKQQSVDHVEVIELLQKKLEKTQTETVNDIEELRRHYESLLESKAREIEELRHDNSERQEAMTRYGKEMESIQHEFRSILEERDGMLQQLECELEEKDTRIQQLEEFVQTKQAEYERQFNQLQATVQGSQAQLSSDFKQQLDRREVTIATNQKALREAQQQIASLRLSLEVAVSSSKETQQQLDQVTRLFTQAKVDMSSLRETFQEESSNKQFQLLKLLENNQQLQQENNKLGSLTLVQREKSQRLEEECQRLSTAVEQQQQRNRDQAAELSSVRTLSERLREELHQLTQLRHSDQLAFNVQQTAAAEEAVRSCTAKLAAVHSSELQLLRSEAIVLRSQLSSLTEDTNKKDKYICLLETENRKGEAALAGYIKSATQQKQQMEGIIGQIEQRKRELLLKEQELSGVRSKLHELECYMDTCKLEQSIDKNAITSLRYEITVLKQSEESLKQNGQARSSEYQQCEQEKKQLQMIVEKQTLEMSQLSERNRQLDQTTRQLTDQITALSVRLNQRDCLLIDSKKAIESNSKERQELRRQLDWAHRQKEELQQKMQGQADLKAREHEQFGKAAAELQHLRKSLEGVVTEYESLRQTHESASNRFLAMKSERDSRTAELEEARMRIRILESENRSIHSIMTEELDKRKRIIEELVREKNCAVNEMERSKIMRQ